MIVFLRNSVDFRQTLRYAWNCGEIRSPKFRIGLPNEKDVIMTQQTKSTQYSTAG